MPKLLILSITVALISGVAIGLQVSLNNLGGRAVGPIITGLVVNFIGGVVAGAILLALFVQKGQSPVQGASGNTLIVLAAAGLLGIVIIGGIAYSFPQLGVATGVAVLLLGQIIVALIGDTLGLTGGQPIPLTWMRLVGAALLLLGAWLTFPRSP